MSGQGILEEDVIVAEGLERRFGEFRAVRGVSFRVRRGEVFGVLGPNGAGKSTTIRMLCGILSPSGGNATVAGIDVARNPEGVKQRIGYMTQRFSLYEDLSVQENMEFYAGVYGLVGRQRRERIAHVIGRIGLEGRKKQLAGTLSGGWKQRVALACATIHEPAIVFLDEPTAGVDPTSRRDFWEQIHRIAHEGTTVLVTTHYMDEAERCHRLCFIFGGAVLDMGTPTEVTERRGLRVAEFEVGRPMVAVSALREVEGVAEVNSLGGWLRVITSNGDDPAALARGAFAQKGVAVLAERAGTASVEDAFVSMVRDTEARQGATVAASGVAKGDVVQSAGGAS